MVRRQPAGIFPHEADGPVVRLPLFLLSQLLANEIINQEYVKLMSTHLLRLLVLFRSQFKRLAIRPLAVGVILPLLLAAVFLRSGASGTPAALIKGPYLIFPGNNSRMQVFWQLDSPSTCSLHWGRSTAYADGTTVTTEFNPATHQHAATLKGLVPGAKYFYELAVGTATRQGAFRAAPPADARALKFMAYGDTRSQPGIHDSVAKAMMDTAAADPDFQTFILHVGDWVGGDSEANWTNEFFTPFATNIQAMIAALPLQGCLGNHEGSGIFYRQYWPYPYLNDRFYWSFDYGPAHIAVIDQYDQFDGPSDAQVQWLHDDLAASGRPWKFLLYHEPAWTAQNGYHSDNTRAQAVLQPLCKQFGIDLCICGHVHLYAHCLQDGVHHITTGGGGAPLYDPFASQPTYVIKTVPAYHFTRIDIRDNGLNFEAVQPDGTVLERIHIQHPQPTGVGPGALKYR